jgi:hypothetical protein
MKKRKGSGRKTNWLEEAKSNIVYLNGNAGHETPKHILITSMILKELQGNRVYSEDNNFFDKFLLGSVITSKLRLFSIDNFDDYNDFGLIKVLSAKKIHEKCLHQYKFLNGEDKNPEKSGRSFSDEALIFVSSLFECNEFNSYIEVHEYENTNYFNKEKFEQVLNYIFTLYNLYSPLKYISSGNKLKNTARIYISNHALEKFVLDELKNSNRFFSHLKELAVSKGYRLEELKKEFKISPEKKTIKAIRKKSTEIKSKKPTVIKKRGKGER